MVCRTRPAIRATAVVPVVLLVLWKLAGHFRDTAALLAVIALVTAGAAIAAAFALATFLSTRRGSAAAGHSSSRQHGAAEAPVPRWPDRPIYRAGPAGHGEQKDRAGSAV
jgi:hypothetical protein